MVHKSSTLAAAISVFWKVITMLSIKNAHEHDGLSRAGKSQLALLNTQRKRGYEQWSCNKILILEQGWKKPFSLAKYAKKERV